MADRYAVASGDWSNPATWDGGTSVPAPGDDVYANTRLVNVDQDVTVANLFNAANAGLGVAVGGGFQVNGAAVITVGSGSVASDATATDSYLILASTVGADLTVVADIHAPRAGTSRTSTVRCTVAGGPPIKIIGDIISDGVNSGRSNFYYTGSKPIHITGNLYSPSASSSAFSGNSASAAAIVVYGDVIKAPGESTTGLFSTTITRSTLAISGAIICDPTTGGHPLPTAVPVLAVAGGNVEFRMYEDVFEGGQYTHPRTLTTLGVNNPDESDVREGVSYGDGGLLTGTLAVPEKEQVASGVPTDDGVGTAILSMSDLAIITGSQIEAAFAT